MWLVWRIPERRAGHPAGVCLGAVRRSETATRHLDDQNRVASPRSLEEEPRGVSSALLANFSRS